MLFLKDQRVLVLGLGESGLAMARWCARCGAASVAVADTRDAPPHAARLASEVPGAVLRAGAFDAALLDGVNLVLKSPGLSPLDPQVAQLLNAARAQGIAVHGELHLFARALADLKAVHRYAPAVLAVTGTNGKTTTASMTAALAARTGARVALAGNIGPTMLDTLGQALDLEQLDAKAAAAPAEEAAPSGEPAAAVVEAQPDAGPVQAAEVATDVTAEVTAEAAAEALTESPAEAASDAPTDAPAESAAEASAHASTEASSTEASSDESIDVGGGPPPHLLPPPPPGPQFEHLPEVWVLELSSFQLNGVDDFEPTAGTVLNLTQDHLDWHGDMAAYGRAKSNVFGREAVMVINRDDPQVEAMIPPPRVVKAATRGARSQTVHRRVVRFGLDAPSRPGDFGIVSENGMTWLVRAQPTDETLKRRKDEEEEIHLQRLMPADALRIRGRHNAANALAALALATAAGLPMAAMLHGLREYRGEPHRVEPVGFISGIEAYDDSKGTNVGATVAALSGLGADKAPGKLVVILGGDGKGQDFGPLASPVARHARAVALIGRDAGLIEQAIAPALQGGVVAQRHDTLEAATQWCFDQAQPGDAVLLSPACASFDMFRNYAHRAEVFVSAVRSLAQSRGEVAA